MAIFQAQTFSGFSTNKKWTVLYLPGFEVHLRCPTEMMMMGLDFAVHLLKDI